MATDLTREYERLRDAMVGRAFLDGKAWTPDDDESDAMVRTRAALDTFVAGLIEHHSTPDSTEAEAWMGWDLAFGPDESVRRCGCKEVSAYGCARYGGGSSCNCDCHAEGRTQSSALPVEVSRHEPRKDVPEGGHQTDSRSTEADDTPTRRLIRMEAEVLRAIHRNAPRLPDGRIAVSADAFTKFAKTLDALYWTVPPDDFRTEQERAVLYGMPGVPDKYHERRRRAIAVQLEGRDRLIEQLRTEPPASTEDART